MKNVKACLAFLVVIAVLGPGCGEKEDHVERERKEVEEALKTTTVAAYKGIKVGLRALPMAEMARAGNSDAARQQAIVDADSRMEAEHIYLLAFDLLNRFSENGPDSVFTGWSLSDYWTVAREIYQLESKLEKIDEDEFPTVLENLTGMYKGVEGNGEILDWYTNAHEHAIFSAVLLASQKAPTDLVLYETSLMKPAQIEDPFLKLGCYALRSNIFLFKDFNYLSEYEATQYLTALKTYREFLVAQAPDAIFEGTMVETDEQIYAQFHIVGVLLRGLARYRIGKEEESMEDLESFLRDAETIGLEGEIVWVIGAYVSLYNEQHAEALVYIRKLKGSPLFGEKEKEFLAEIEGYVQSRESGNAMNKLFDKVFIAKMVVQIVYAYASEVEWRDQIESTETGKQLFELGDGLVEEYNEVMLYITVDGLREKGKVLGNEGQDLLDQVDTDELTEEGKKLIEEVDVNEAKEKGKKLFEGVKGWLKQDSSE